MNIYGEDVLKNYRYYPEYLSNRNININTANKYDIGYDQYNNQITFPIRDIYGKCLAIGRRDILRKAYRYPYNFQKPLYGVFELAQFLNYVFIVERSF